MNILENIINNESLKIIILSMLPITELRFSIPYGINFYKISPIQVIILSCIGNILIGVSVIYIIGPIMRFMQKISFFKFLITSIFKRTINRTKSIERKKFFGLILFVSIPLPLTGVWTGSLAAYLLNLNRKLSIYAIIIGVLISATIVSALTFLSIDLL